MKNEDRKKRFLNHRDTYHTIKVKYSVLRHNPICNNRIQIPLNLSVRLDFSHRFIHITKYITDKEKMLLSLSYNVSQTAKKEKGREDYQKDSVKETSFSITSKIKTEEVFLSQFFVRK